MSQGFRIIVGSLMAATLAVSAGCSQTEPESTSVLGEDSEPLGAVEEVAEVEDSATTAEYRVVENIPLPAPGADPLQMIFELRQPNPEMIGSEQIRVSYPAIDQAVVVWVQRGLLDDSVSAMRTRYEFRRVEGSESAQPLWQVVQVTQQNRCHAGRGAEDWTGELCH